MSPIISHRICDRHKLPGLLTTDHRFEVPLDHDRVDSEKIEIFAREVVAASLADNHSLPWLIFFQGGPGFPSPRPYTRSGWLGKALERYRVLLLDQRGTGSSSPVTAQTIVASEKLDTPEKQAEYLSHFRADSIVKDAEAIRVALLGENRKWTALGQSYGGFCIVNYLSEAPQGLEAALITGGLPPLSAPIDDIYRATYKRCLQKNDSYYRRYPGDREKAQEIASYLEKEAGGIRLPSGGLLTVERFQQLGIAFGASDGFEQIHYLLEDAFLETGKKKQPSLNFLKNIEQSQPFESNPLYALLHEAIYCQKSSSRWSAHRIREEFQEFDFSSNKHESPLYFTGEMIYPWMLDIYPGLTPLKEAAELLASKEDWGMLYDRRILTHNEVPTVAAVYYEDMYVESGFSEETARHIGNTRIWLTNEYEHNGLRANGESILSRLLAMLDGEV